CRALSNILECGLRKDEKLSAMQAIRWSLRIRGEFELTPALSFNGAALARLIVSDLAERQLGRETDDTATEVLCFRIRKRSRGVPFLLTGPDHLSTAKVVSCIPSKAG